MRTRRRLPDFAGVALVDILANGLAMLIIVIVLSIASRAERDAQTSSQVEQVETMMSRKFSTSLVLNSLAASPPARLHDYENSALDQIRDPNLLPILELHHGFVREFYSGAIWTRRELLLERNAMDAWLLKFDELRKARIRIDVYDIAQFYLAMSILREHGIIPRHWHFLAGGLPMGQAFRCPPGVAARDCAGGNLASEGELPVLPRNPGAEYGDGPGGDGDADTWPPEFAERGARGGVGAGADAEGAPFPGGAVLGDGIGGIGAGELGGQGSGGDPNGNYFTESFPGSQPGFSRQRGLLDSGSSNTGVGEGGGEEGIRFRLSTPESQELAQLLGEGDGELSPEQILSVLLHYLSGLQATLDEGKSPSAQLAGFEQYLIRALGSPPRLRGDNRRLLDYLLLQLWGTSSAEANSAASPRARLPAPLKLVTRNVSAPTDTMLIVPSNQRLQEVVVQQSVAPEDANPPEFPAEARLNFHLNSQPDGWRGLALPLQPDAILLLPPNPVRPTQLRWRALAYLAPKFDDFIIGFVYAAVDADGQQVMLHGEDNRVRLDGRALRSPYRATVFGARDWLAALYGGLVLVLLGLVLLVRHLSSGSSRSRNFSRSSNTSRDAAAKAIKPAPRARRA